MQTLSTTHPTPIAELKAAIIAHVKSIWKIELLLRTDTGFLKHGNDQDGIYQFWNIKKPHSKYHFQVDYLKDDFFIRFKLTAKDFLTENN